MTGRMHRLRAVVVLAAALAAIGLAASSPAAASSAEVSGSTLRYTAGNNETNNLTISQSGDTFTINDTGATITRSGDHGVEISANADDRATAVLDVFKDKLIKRNQSLKVLEAGDPRQSGRESKINVTLKEGISQEQAKKVGKLIRDEGPKGVKVQVQGDELRVSSKKRDDLQAVIALVKGQDYDFPVQFTNYR